MILHGDSLERLKEFPDNHFDSVVTDPPYGLAFMGKKWDYDVPSEELWREVFRVLKPGGHLLSFGGTRTYHRMVVAIEEAGFEIRDQIMWIYGSGFPKSHDVSKGIDKAAGAEREVIGVNPSTRPNHGNNANLVAINQLSGECNITAPSTDSAKQWQGWGTALKPANEPIVLARKPLSESTVAKNVLKWGTGALNIDASRVSVRADDPNHRKPSVPFTGRVFNVADGGSNGRPKDNLSTAGRWPANLLLDEEAAAQIGEPSRFFYVAKASKRERNAGLEGEVKEKQGARPNSADATGKFPDHDHRPSGGNNHPTVKPVKLMEYLVRLITPPNGLVLDPFAGSGSTGVACKNLGFEFLGIEMNEEYVEIAKRRVGE